MRPSNSIAYHGNIRRRNSKFLRQFINILFSFSTPSYFSNLRFGEFGHSMFFSLIKVGASIVSWVKIFKVFNSVISYITIFMTNFISFWSRTYKGLCNKNVGGYNFMRFLKANRVTKVSTIERIRFGQKSNMGSSSGLHSH